ncbi:hypothetical protein niasHT_023961 [Heterodera trifolii]|uniref:Uncharacterized protein n=1 Tax=Heterodera trifolii TaxID=157864 RepID=A0ABD2JVL4_9BILA
MSQTKASLLAVFLGLIIVCITESKKNAEADNGNNSTGMVSKIGRIFTGVLALSSVAPSAANASQTGGAVQAVHQQQLKPQPQMPIQNLPQETPVPMKNRETSLIRGKESAETVIYGKAKHNVPPSGPSFRHNRHKKGTSEEKEHA